jgi:hypothetical protein
MEILVAVIVGKVMFSPTLCDVDYLINNQIHTIQYVCQDDGFLLKENNLKLNIN